MYNKFYFLFLVLCLAAYPAVSLALDSQQIKGPDGHMVSKAQIIQAYEHVADNLALVDAMLKYGPQKLVYHNDGGFWDDGQWALRYDDEDHMKEEARDAAHKAINWRNAILQLLPPYIGDTNFTFDWRDFSYQSANLETAFVYKVFPENEVEDVLDSLNKVTVNLEYDQFGADSKQGDKAGEELDERLKTSRNYLLALLKMRAPGGVKVPKYTGELRSDIEELVYPNGRKSGRKKNPKKRNTSNTNNKNGRGPADMAVHGERGQGGAPSNLNMLGQTTEGTKDLKQQVTQNTTSKHPDQKFNLDQKRVSHNNKGGAIDKINQQAYIPLQLINQGIKPQNIPSAGDTVKMDALLNGMNNNQAFPNSQMNIGGKNGSGKGGFNPLGLDGYVAVIEGMGPLMIVQLSDADRKLLENKKAMHQVFTQDFMSTGMNQQEASKRAAHIVNSLSQYTAANNVQYIQQNGQNGQNGQSGQVTNNNQGNNQNNYGNLGSDYNTNTGAGNNGLEHGSANTSNNSNNSASRGELVKQSFAQMQNLNKYMSGVYPEQGLKNMSAQNIQNGFNKKSQNNQGITVQQEYYKDAIQLEKVYNNSAFVKLLGSNHRDVKRLKQQIAGLRALHSKYSGTSNSRTQREIINKIKQLVPAIHKSMAKVNRAIEIAHS